MLENPRKTLREAITDVFSRSDLEMALGESEPAEIGRSWLAAPPTSTGRFMTSSTARSAKAGSVNWLL
jgi:hypothetical protein